jgi:hypothetical protein
LKSESVFANILHRTFVGYLCLLTVFCLNACKPSNSSKESEAFYYWKTHYLLNTFEKEYLKKQNVQKIYLHCFDVTLEDGLAKPQGVLLWKDSALQGMDYIPTVFIQNENFLHADSNYSKELANHILLLSSQIMAAQNLPLKEIQIDCDWTETTRNAYFYFLKCMKQQKILLSATLRLYQYKYAGVSGIPPVDYVSLMCYNMGNMKTENGRNSIINEEDLKAYLKTTRDYPLPMNIALPIFNWTLLYSNHVLKGILYRPPDLQSRYWKRSSEINYICVEEYYDSLCARTFYAKQSVRVENISKKELKQALHIIQQYVNNSKNEIIYFDLDSNKIRHCLY